MGRFPGLKPPAESCSPFSRQKPSWLLDAIDGSAPTTSLLSRMKALGRLLLFLMLGSNLCLYSQEADADKSILDAIKRREDQYTDGLLRRDFEELASVFADTYVNTSPSGQLRSKAEFLEALQADTSRISEIKETDKQTHVYGETAVVTVQFEVQGTDQGEPFDFKGRATDIWVKQNGQWFCVAVHSSPTK